MSKITILSEHLANQIAAGEVIERPAAVVKELLENAIDANARRVTIEVAGSGTRLIRVMDNGDGMDQDDLLLCLERHATSKLAGPAADAAKLAAIRTLGFRGEAIPSIASVARLTITSRTREAQLGAMVEVAYGRVLKVHETGCQQGTLLEVRNLFGNQPARKKFLKSNRTELGHIEEVVKNHGLAAPGLGITYVVENRTVLNLPAGTDSGEQRFRRVLGRQAPAPLLEIIASIEERGLTISGWLLPPDEAAAGSARLRLFVNGRAIKDRMLVHAVHEGLAGFMMKGRTAAGVLFLDLPPTAVDVNVHPTKQEVRLQDARFIHQQMATAVRRAMAAYQEQARFSLFGRGEESGPGPVRVGRPATASLLSDQPGTAAAARVYEQQHPLPPGPPSPYLEEPRPSYAGPLADAETTPWSTPGESEPAGPAGLVPIGQLSNLYILCQGEDGLVVIDQHAAHERILFEELKEQFSQRRITGQALLFPKIVDLGPDLAETLDRNREELDRLGFNLEEFGDDSYLIKAVPTLLSRLDPEEILRDIVGRLQGDSPRPRDSGRIDSILATMACKAAVKAGRRLQPGETEGLLARMQAGNAFSHCPHGRPTFKSFSMDEIKKWFHRG
ncbi:MAG: DNA mismatch repair endonuclease MutL [Desulfobacterales bacterium]|nr:DNA mismatch repair endonuclease MutL [Desulfobacterales bacterium]